MTEITPKSLREFIETKQLYCAEEFTEGLLWKPSNLWFSEIDAFCPRCKKEKTYLNTEEVIRSRGGMTSSTPKPRIKSGIHHFDFKCVSCFQKVCIWVDAKVKESTYVLEKIGEIPRKRLDRDTALQKFFSDDQECYERALVCLSHGYGIAAYAYMRRIAENHIDSLLSLVTKEVEASNPDPELIEKIETLHGNSPMSEKIRIANIAIPSSLNPDGLNPLGKIYKALSEGIHSRSESECLESATNLMESIRYLISELTERSKNRNQYLKITQKI